MPTLKSAIDINGEAFQAHNQVHRALAAQLRERVAAASLGGPEESRKRHEARGKLLPRERVMRLLDAGSPLYDGEAPGAGVITGIGRVAGREVMIVANDATVNAGAYFPLTVKGICALRTRSFSNLRESALSVDMPGRFATEAAA